LYIQPIKWLHKGIHNYFVVPNKIFIENVTFVAISAAGILVVMATIVAVGCIYKQGVV
jgi:hypothetical protein